jgi:nitrous oxide reductase
MNDDKLSRRELLGVGAAAVTGAASVANLGCALLPSGGAAPTAHRCDHRHCRWFRQTSRGEGRCALAARVSGGEP